MIDAIISVSCGICRAQFDVVVQLPTTPGALGNVDTSAIADHMATEHAEPTE